MKIPPGALVVLVGPPASGKSTFAWAARTMNERSHYHHLNVVSSDALRMRLFGYDAMQGIAGPAHDAVFAVAHAELAAGLSQRQTVLFDATNLTPRNQRTPRDIAAEHDAPLYVILFDDATEDTMRRRNSERLRVVPNKVMDKMFARMRSLNAAQVWPEATIIRTSKTPPDTIQFSETGWDRQLTQLVDIVGDIHGSKHTLETLTRRLGYRDDWTHPDGRTLVSAGDVADRGAYSMELVEAFTEAVHDGRVLAVKGNHEAKLARYLWKMYYAAVDPQPGKPRSPEEVVANLRSTQGHAHGLTHTLHDYLINHDAVRWARTAARLDSWPTHMLFDGGRLVVAHGAIRQDLYGRHDREAEAWFLYGAPTGKTTADGLPIRRDWQSEYNDQAFAVTGHNYNGNTEPRRVGKTLMLDTGAGHGVNLSSLRWEPSARSVSGGVTVVPVDSRDIDQRMEA